MSYDRLAYDDQDSALQMATDCTLAADALGTVPSIRYEDFPREIRKPEITVTDAAAFFASRLHLHLD